MATSDRERAVGTEIVSAQFNFSPEELAYIDNNYIHLDHEQAWSGSAGVAYTLNRTSDHPTRFSADAILQTGLRASTRDGPERHGNADLWRGEPVGRAEAAHGH